MKIWRRRGEESNGGRCNGEEETGPATENTGSPAVAEAPARRLPPGKIVASVAYPLSGSLNSL